MEVLNASTSILQSEVAVAHHSVEIGINSTLATSTRTNTFQVDMVAENPSVVDVPDSVTGHDCNEGNALALNNSLDVLNSINDKLDGEALFEDLGSKVVSPEKLVVIRDNHVVDPLKDVGLVSDTGLMAPAKVAKPSQPLLHESSMHAHFSDIGIMSFPSSASTSLAHTTLVSSGKAVSPSQSTHRFLLTYMGERRKGCTRSF
jgi:hypothetical protein